MRFSTTAPLAAQDLTSPRISNEDSRGTPWRPSAPPHAPARCSLVGGRSRADLIVRRPRRTCAWTSSRATGARRRDPRMEGRARLCVGVEVSPTPPADAQVPDRNGATLFELAATQKSTGALPQHLAFADIAFRSPPAARGSATAPRPADTREAPLRGGARAAARPCAVPVPRWLRGWRAFTAAPYRLHEPEPPEPAPTPAPRSASYAL